MNDRQRALVEELTEQKEALQKLERPSPEGLACGYCGYVYESSNAVVF